MTRVNVVFGRISLFAKQRKRKANWQSQDVRKDLLQVKISVGDK